MANDIAQQFAGLPIEDLIVSPLVGMAKGQAKLNDVTWKYISEVAFEPADPNDPKNKKVKTRFLDVQLNRYVTNPNQHCCQPGDYYHHQILHLQHHHWLDHQDKLLLY